MIQTLLNEPYISLQFLNLFLGKMDKRHFSNEQLIPTWILEMLENRYSMFERKHELMNKTEIEEFFYENFALIEEDIFDKLHFNLVTYESNTEWFKFGKLSFNEKIKVLGLEWYQQDRDLGKLISYWSEISLKIPYRGL